MKIIENNLTETELEALIKFLDNIKYEDEREEGEQYYYINNMNDILVAFNFFDEIDNKRYELGNYFKIKEEAERQAKYLKIKVKIKKILEIINKDKKE